MRTILTLIAVTVGWATAAAQPDLSGTWAVMPARSVWVSPSGEVQHIRVFGERFTVYESGTELEIKLDDEGVIRRYRLDGHPHTVMHPSPNGMVPLVAVAEWVNDTLAIELSEPGPAGRAPKTATTRRLSLNSDGTLLVSAPWGPGGQPLGTVYRRNP